MEIMEVIMESFDANPILRKIFWSMVVIAVVMILTRLIKNLIFRKVDDSHKFYPIKRVVNYVSGTVMVICILFIWLDSVSNLTTYVGLLSAGIAIALKEIFTNLAGCFFIEIRKPFDVGHRILIGTEKGDVIDKRLFQFSLMEVSGYEEGEQSTGRIIDIPNSFVFMYPIVNYTKGFEYIWNEIPILLTFESNWKKAKDLLLEIAKKDTYITTEHASRQIKESSRKYMIHYNKLTPIVYTDIKESGIQLTVRYLCEPKMRRTTTNRIWEDVLDMLEANEDIALAYPTRRVVND